MISPNSLTTHAFRRRAARLFKRVIGKTRTFLPSYKFAFPGAPTTSPKSPYPFAVQRDNFLEELGAKYLPTKRMHNYLVYYWMHFRDIRLNVKRVLEIGVETDRSIRMWEEFFPHAIIYGMDIDPNCKQFEGGRRKIFIGDQSDRAFLNTVADTIGALDIIIDDGSHDTEDQLRCFEFFFPKMSDHGIYVVEDTGGCVRDFGLRTVNSLKALIDSVMYWPPGFDPQNWQHLLEFRDDASWISKNVVGVAFYRWIVFVMRGNNPKDNPFLTALPETDKRWNGGSLGTTTGQSG